MDITTGSDIARNFPENPGVYKMYAGTQLLYVGKAKNLKSRVLSYFSKNLDRRLSRMINQVTHIDFIVVPTEIDALILESQLVKQENPRYNIMLRDDKGFPYLRVTTEAPFPSLSVTYKKNLPGTYFGPFPSKQNVYDAVEVLNRHFLLRTCDDVFFKSRSRPCMEYQMQRCSAPCVGKISEKKYQENISLLLGVLGGKGAEVLQGLSEKMDVASEAEDYERALLFRNRITSLRYVQSKITVEAGVGDYDVLSLSTGGMFAVASLLFVRNGKVVGTSQLKFESFDDAQEDLLRDAIARFVFQKAPLSSRLVVPKEYLTDDVISAVKQIAAKTSLSAAGDTTEEGHLNVALQSSQSALSTLQSVRSARTLQMEDLVTVLGLSSVPVRVECFDISHLQGTETVASQVVFNEWGPLKGSYRRYNIENSKGDDLAAMREALERRFKNTSDAPELLLIDGGATQVNVAMQVLRQHNLNIPCIGVSKGVRRIEGEEKLIIGATGEELELGERSPALQYIQAVRNEAHRFAITGHRKKRQKKMLVSSLEKIDGVGKKKRQDLLNAFGGFSGLKSATLEQISQVSGIGKTLAEKVFFALHGES